MLTTDQRETFEKLSKTISELAIVDIKYLQKEHNSSELEEAYAHLNEAFNKINKVWLELER